MHGPTAAWMFVAPRAERSIAVYGRIGHSGERAAPARVGRADDAGLGVGEQYRRAIGCQDSEQQVRPVRDHRVGARPLAPAATARST